MINYAMMTIVRHRTVIIISPLDAGVCYPSMPGLFPGNCGFKE